MKEHLLVAHCPTRRSIDDVAKALGFSSIGSRSAVMNLIKTASYQQIKRAIN